MRFASINLTILFLLCLIAIDISSALIKHSRLPILQSQLKSSELSIVTLQDALDFDATDSTRTCDDYYYADRRLKYFEGVVENMTTSIPQEELNSQISLLQEIKLMMQQLKVTIPAYSDTLSLIQVKPSLLGSSFATLQIASNYDLVNQEKFISFQTKLESFFSETYDTDAKLELIDEIIVLIDSLIVDLKEVKLAPNYSQWSQHLSLSIDSITTIINDLCILCDPSCKTCDILTPNICTSCESNKTLQGDLCVACDSSCLTCSGPSATECLTCNDPLMLRDSDNACVGCDSSCLTCFGPNSNECLTCNSPMILSSDNSCAQIVCDPSCETCFGPGPNECSTCLNPQVLNADNSCSEFVCHSSCKTCYSSGSLLGKCETCESSNILTEDFQCVACDSSCLTCSGQGPKDCLSCIYPAFLNADNECEFICDASCNTCSGPTSKDCKTCISPKVLNGDNECVLCHSSCQTCTGPLETDCETCESSKVIDNGRCLPCDSSCKFCKGAAVSDCTFCFDGFFLLEGFCEACDSSCVTCSGDSEEECVSCDETTHHLRNGRCCNNDCNTCSGPAANQCLTCTGEGIFLYEDSCVSCHSNCATCSGPLSNQCNSCVAPLQHKEGICFACDDSCSTCSGPEPTSCLTCDPPTILSSNNECVLCHETCDTCNGTLNTDCLSCLSPLILYEGQCVSCDVSCENCVGPLANQCSSCLSPLIFNEGSCSACHENCLTCSGLSSNDCIKCQDRHYLSGSSCFECDISCIACNGSTSSDCLSCDPFQHLSDGHCCAPSCSSCFGPDSDSCLSCSNPEEVLNEGRCSQCDPLCKTCYGPDSNECLTCNEPQILSEGSCVSCHESCETCAGVFETDCISCKYPLIYMNGVCSQCDKSCLTCSGISDNQCNSCSEPAVLLEDRCVVCDDSCLTCQGEGASNCTSCEESANLFNGQCIVCDVSCAKCSGPTNEDCTVCESPSVYASGKCILCDVSCELCSGNEPNQCLTCDESHVLLENRCCDLSCASCSGPSSNECSSCSDGFTLNNGTCLPCDSSCSTCKGLTETDCLSCNAFAIISEGRCCDKSCDKCSGPSDTECTNCATGLTLSNGTCLFQPPPTCDTPCATCSVLSKSVCLTCAAGYSLVDNTCILCDNSCDSCVGTGLNQCVTCSSPFELINGYCCDESCETCEGPFHCTSCLSGQVLLANDTCATCHVSCGECAGTSLKDCLTCSNPNNILINGQCCHQSCESCSLDNPNFCLSCHKGALFISEDGICISNSNDNKTFYVAYDDAPLTYMVSTSQNPNISSTGDIVIGLWTRYLNYIPKTMNWNEEHTLFELYTETASEMAAGIPTFSAYFNSTAYIFETYQKSSSGVVTKLRETISGLSAKDIENSWNLVVLAYNKGSELATAYVKFNNSQIKSVNLSKSAISHDSITHVLNAYFCQKANNRTRGFNGQISSPIVLYGKNIVKNLMKIWDGYFPYPALIPNEDQAMYFVNPALALVNEFTMISQHYHTEFLETKRYSAAGWFNFRHVDPKNSNPYTERTLLEISLDSTNTTTSPLTVSFYPSSQTFKLSYLPAFAALKISKNYTAPTAFTYTNLEDQWFFVYVGYDSVRRDIKFGFNFTTSSVKYTKMDTISEVLLFTPFSLSVTSGGTNKRGNNGVNGAIYASNTAETAININALTKLYPNYADAGSVWQNISIFTGELNITDQMSVVVNDSAVEGITEYGIYFWFKANFGDFQKQSKILSLTIENENKTVNILSMTLFEGNKTLLIESYKVNGTGDALYYSLKTQLTYSPDEKMAYVYVGYQQSSKTLFYYFSDGSEKKTGTLTDIFHYSLPDKVLVSFFATNQSTQSYFEKDASFLFKNPVIMVGPGSFQTQGHDTIASWENLGSTANGSTISGGSIGRFG